jgi:hypothetical protein
LRLRVIKINSVDPEAEDYSPGVIPAVGDTIDFRYTVREWEKQP